MNKDVERYITRNYYELLQITKKITKGHDLTEDLFHEVIMQLYDKKVINLKKYTDNDIKYYIVAIIRTNWYSVTSPFYYKIRREFKMYDDLSECLSMEADQESFEKEQLLCILEESFCDLNWFQKSLFELYMGLGSLSKVSKQTTIPISSVAKYMKEAKLQIKNDIQRKLWERE
jgi:DNA-directed RNA polymerase specialized sigma24 family protein